MHTKQKIAVSLLIVVSLIVFGVISLVNKNTVMQNALLTIFLVEHAYVVMRCYVRLLDKKSVK